MVTCVRARRFEWDPIRGSHQGQRSCAARTGRTHDLHPTASRTLNLLATRAPSTHDHYVTVRWERSLRLQRIEVITGVERQPTWSQVEKRSVLAESLEDGIVIPSNCLPGQ